MDVNVYFNLDMKKDFQHEKSPNRREGAYVLEV